jgi:transcriptional regulator with XRE-family HTH domain
MEKLNPEYISKIRQLIGDWIREFRKDKGLTQLDVSKMLGVNEATVSKIEAGKWLSLEMLIKLSIHLDFYIFLLEKSSEDELAKVMRDRWRRAHEEN